MASKSMSYEDPNYTLIRQHQAHSAAGELGNIGIKPGLTFRSRVAAVVTQISAIMQGSVVPSATVILTLLFNGSVAAVLTLEESINQTIGTFTLTANRTLTTFSDRFEVSTVASFSADASIAISYEYRIVPGSTFSLNAVLT